MSPETFGSVISNQVAGSGYGSATANKLNQRNTGERLAAKVSVKHQRCKTEKLKMSHQFHVVTKKNGKKL